MQIFYDIKIRRHFLNATIFKVFKNLSILFFIIGEYSFELFAEQNNIQLSNPDSLLVAKTINQFIDAFTTLNWKEFTQYFADDATAFFRQQHFLTGQTTKMKLKIFSKVYLKMVHCSFTMHQKHIFFNLTT